MASEEEAHQEQNWVCSWCDNVVSHFCIIMVYKSNRYIEILLLQKHNSSRRNEFEKVRHDICLQKRLQLALIKFALSCKLSKFSPFTPAGRAALL